MSMPTLTRGAVKSACAGEILDNAVMQVLLVKPIEGPATNGGAKRFRLMLSDGEHTQQAMLATQLNNLIESNKVNPFCIVRLDDYVSNEVSGRKIIIILNLTVVHQGPGSRIGEPTPVGSGAQPQQQQQQQQQQPQQQQQNFYGGGQARQQPQQQHNNNNNNNNRQFQPIASLNPYQGTFTIKARVTNKSDIRTYSNARGEGKVFNVDLLDAQGGEIQATMFNTAADKFFPVFQAGKVFVISNGVLKLANKRFSSIKNDYSLTLNDDATVDPVVDDTSIAAQHFDFVPLNRLSACETGSTVDVLGVVTAVGEKSTIMSKKNRELQKRTITITDDTATSIELTMWGDEAVNNTEHTMGGNPVVAVKAARIGDYGGISLSTSFSGVTMVDPDIDRAHKLRAWFKSKGQGAQVTALTTGGGGRGPTERYTIAGIQNAGLGRGDKADYFDVRGTVVFFNTGSNEKPPWYTACPSPGCKKKVSQEGDGRWYCAKCAKHFDTNEPRFILSVLVADFTDQQWMTAFNDSAQRLINGTTAVEMQKLLESDSNAEYDAVFRKANFKQYVLRCRAKEESVNEELRLKVSIESVNPVNFVDESKKLLDRIAKYDSVKAA